jgi:hypothetical protein
MKFPEVELYRRNDQGLHQTESKNQKKAGDLQNRFAGDILDSPKGICENQDH